MEKQKLLFIGIIMNSGGTEKSFLSFMNCLDFDKYDADLILAKNQGLFMPLLDKRINVRFMPEYGELFLLSGKNAVRNLFGTFVKKNPLTLFEIAPYFFKLVLSKKHRVKTATKLFIKMMGKTAPVTEHYDAAVAYWGERSMFYMIDKVPNAKKKIAWMHFEYDMPPKSRDDAIFLDYFSKCGNIINVSAAVDAALKTKFPEIAAKCSVIENINSPVFIRNRALEPESFTDAHFTGLRILTVARIAEQKGLDLIPKILARLKKDKYNLRWYILGEGDEGVKARVVELALKHGAAEMLIFLGTSVNPYPFMRDCDIYVQPSKFEGKPITVEEAKILRCPIVCADYLSAKEQLANGKYGRIAAFDPDSLYENIKELLDRPELREGFTKTLSLENFGNETEIDKFYNILNN